MHADVSCLQNNQLGWVSKNTEADVIDDNLVLELKERPV